MATALANIQTVCITKTEKAESEAQRGKPKGTLESESRKMHRQGADLTKKNRWDTEGRGPSCSSYTSSAAMEEDGESSDTVDKRRQLTSVNDVAAQFKKVNVLLAGHLCQSCLSRDVGPESSG